MEGLTPPEAPAPRGAAVAQRLRRAFIKATAGLVVVSILGCALWVWGALAFVYSHGERAGYVQKFSRRGWIIKTWEGELAMVNLPGATTEIFPFSIREAEVAQQLQATMGQRVVLSYNQHRGLPPGLFGDTSYFVVEVRPVDEKAVKTPS